MVKRKAGAKDRKPTPHLSPMYALIQERINNFHLGIAEDDQFVLDPDEHMHQEIKFYGVVLYDKAEQEKFFGCCASPECYNESVMIKLTLQTNEDNGLHQTLSAILIRSMGFYPRRRRRRETKRRKKTNSVI